LGDPRWITALGLSLTIAAATAVMATVIAFLTAWCARCRLPAGPARALDLVVLSPLFFPHAALGVALVNLLALWGLVGTAWGILVAHLVCTLPFAYRPVAVSMQRISPEMLEASAILGAGEGRTALRVLVPLCRPGLVTALLFSFIVSLDEVTVTMFLTGPDMMTLPVEIYAYIQENASPVLAAVSTAMVAATLLLVLVLERTVGLEFFVEEDAA
jgi:putative spermidine/putrescine transport system permease protein